MGTAAAVLEQYVQQTLLPQGLPIHIDFQVLLATTWLAVSWIWKDYSKSESDRPEVSS